MRRSAELRATLAGDVLASIVKSPNTTIASLTAAYNFALAAAASGRQVVHA